MQGELISVNITTFNRKNVLKRCINSVINQNYENIEIIIVDDGSKESIDKILSAYDGRKAKLKYFKNENNKGNAYSRNVALKHSRGQYIAFMDDDDEWIDERKLEKQIKIFKRHVNRSIGIVCSSVVIKNSKGHLSKKMVCSPSNLKKHLLKENGIIYSSTVICKKSVIDNAGGFDERFNKRVDWEFYTNCVVNNLCTVHFMPDMTTKIYEDTKDRLTLSNSLKGIKNSMDAEYLFIKKYFRHYLSFPELFVYRLRTLFIVLLRYMLVKHNIRNINDNSLLSRIKRKNI